ncbi:MAG: penicillin-binding protein 1A [Hyphomicrobiales bacterium]|nr:penicillin-binding protein 1A [Hyphomicrobiales bacterium]
MAKQKKSPGRIEPVFNEQSNKSATNNRPARKKRVVNTKRRKTGKKRRTSRKNAGLTGKLIARSFYWSMVAGVWMGIAALAVIAWHAMLLPHTSVWAIPDRPPNARIVAVDGELIANRGVTGGAAMSLNDMSPYIPMAVIAIEDRRFKHHYGVDPMGMARAMGRNLLAGRFIQGGSTLTQQLAKNLFLEPQRTLKRKIQEAILAVWLESRFSKDEILELYLNRVYFGSGAYGVDAASHRYFGKSARNVNLAEAAILAAVLKAPSRLSPARNPKLAKKRAKLVLTAMRHQGYISDHESAAALTMQAKKAKRFWSGSEHYVADMVMKQASQLVGEMQSDLIISTTIDIDLQKKAGYLINNTLTKSGKRRNIEQGALVSLDGTGAIRAMVGGREYATSQFNRATDAKRQPGSAFKPFVFLASLEAGRTPQSIRNDAPVRIGKWTPVNYDRKYRGEVTLTTALAKSLNTIAAQLVMETGPAEVVKLAHRLGIKSKITNNASIALGTSETTLLEITSAYAPFANGGYRAEPFLIKRITDSKGKILYQRQSIPANRVIGERELGMMNKMLQATLESGTGRNARLKKWPAAGKTGTSQNFRDGWFIGYTTNLTTGIWFGNDDGSPTSKLTGGGLPARTWKKYMEFAHAGLPSNLLPRQQSSIVSAIPIMRPAPPVTISGKLPELGIGKEPRPIGASHQTTGTIRPSRGLDSSGKKPGSILDLLFGN